VAAKVDRASLDRAVEIMRRRVEGVGVVPASIRVEGAHQISVELPDAGNVQAAQEIVGQTAQLYFYDWEPNVVGPNGTTGPNSGALTGGEEPASVGAGLPEYEAVLRAAKRPPILRPNDTTLQPGCTAAQVGGCIYGSWYLLDTKHEKMLCPSGAPICGPADTKAELDADHYRRPAGAQLKAVHVNPGTVLVEAHPEESNNRIVNSAPNSFYVINDDPVLSGEDIDDPRQGLFNYQHGLLNNGEGPGQPDVVFGFSSSHSQMVFERLTREIAHRGQEAQLTGVPKARALQHFAVVLDEQVINAPPIDYTLYPEGIGADGPQITGSFTLASARKLADQLQSGSPPIKLELISSLRASAIASP